MTVNELRFDGQVALVTGSGRGVGRCHALTLAQRGAKVVVADSGGAADGAGTSSDPAEAVVEEINAAGGDAIACHASVADEAGASSMVHAALETWGRLDVVINNAGISDPENFEDQTIQQFRRMLDVQYLGTVLVTKAAWPHFIDMGRGQIVNTCSEGPLGIHGKMTSYGGAKGGVIGFTLALAAEAPKHGVQVNGFSPRASTRLSSPDALAKVYDVPAEQFETAMAAFPPDLASPAAVYLAHDSCELNGVILVCGGSQVLRLAFSENEGYRSEQITVEEIATNIKQVIDMSDAQVVGLDMAANAISDDQSK
jgi:NAD(P)-dependent dehydrogenase (short-subunit alcohol dehydrogenase family)